MAEPAKTPLEFSAEQDASLQALTSSMRILSVLLFVSGALWIATGVLSSDFFVGVWGVVRGGLVILLSLVLGAGATDIGYAYTTKGNDQAHISNAFASLGVYYTIMSVLVALIALVSLGALISS